MVTVTTSAPGKIILCGEHAVVYEKEALAFSLGTRTTCCIKEDSEQSLLLKLTIPSFGIDERQFDLTVLEKLYSESSHSLDDVTNACLLDGEEEIYDEYLSSETNSRNKLAFKLVLVLYMHIAHGVIKNRNHGISIAFKSELPIGAGLGSSASFAVATSSALLVLTGQLACDQEKWKEADYELVNAWAFQAERIIHGTPSGIDNSVITYGHCVSFKAKKIDRLAEFSNLNIKVLVINTKKERSTKALVAGVRERKEKFQVIYQHIMDAIERVTDRFKSCLQDLSKGGVVDKAYKEMEMLTDLNQNLLRALGVCHPTIDRAVSLCSQHNLHAKLTGAGGGGCVFAIIPPSYSDGDLACLKDRFRAETCFDVWVTRLGEDGVQLDSFVP